MKMFTILATNQFEYAYVMLIGVILSAITNLIFYHECSAPSQIVFIKHWTFSAYYFDQSI